MPTRIDHVIVAGRDLDALEALYARLGFSVSGGGTHPHLGTRNRIVVLGQDYVELLGVADVEMASPVLTRRLFNTDTGWVGFAVQSDDIARETEAMRSRGVDVRGPIPGRLVAPGGSTRSWRVTMIGDDDLWAAAEPLPFLIQHDTTGEDHWRELAGAEGVAAHPNGAQRVSAVYLAVRDLEAAAASFARAYSLQGGASRYDDFLRADAVTLPLASDGERIVLARPAGSGPVQRRLDDVGEGVCAVSLTVASRAETEAELRRRGIGYVGASDSVWVTEREMAGAPLAFTSQQ